MTGLKAHRVALAVLVGVFLGGFAQLGAPWPYLVVGALGAWGALAWGEAHEGGPGPGAGG